MPFLGQLLLFLAGPLVIKALVTLGIGIVTFVGVDALVSAALNEIVSRFSGLPAAVAQIAGLLGVDVAITIILSAYSIRLVLAGLTSVGIRRFQVG